MPRPWTELVRDWPVLAATIWYLALITAVEKATDPPAIQVTLELLDHGQKGRRITVTLPLPIRLAGLTADYLIAAGIELRPQGRIRPKDTVGRTICLRFDPPTNQPTAFKSDSKGANSHDRNQHAEDAPASSAGWPRSATCTEATKPDGDGNARG